MGRAPRALTRAFAYACVSACVAACAPGIGADEDAARDAALRELFLVRERVRTLVVWGEPAARGPVFAELRDADTAPADRPPPDAIGGVSVVAVRRRDLDALFRAHADGWRAFFARYPGSDGLVELSPVRRDGAAASLLVGRSCGEHCRAAWRVRLRRVGGAWRVTDVAFVRVPDT